MNSNTCKGPFAIKFKFMPAIELFKWTLKKLILYLWGTWILEQSSASQEVKSLPFLN